MAPKNLIQAPKDSLEQQSQFEDKPVSINLQYDEKLAKATISQLIDGQWRVFEVWARDLGVSDPISYAE